jgi:hypothetical protein
LPDGEELHVGLLGGPDQHLERGVVVDPESLGEDALGSSDQVAAVDRRCRWPTCWEP